MSNDRLAGVEMRIENLFDEFKNAVSENDAASSKRIAADLLEAIDERNKKCKMLK